MCSTASIKRLAGCGHVEECNSKAGGVLQFVWLVYSCDFVPLTIFGRRTQTLETQLFTFRAIVSIITKYPQLRSLFKDVMSEKIRGGKYLSHNELLDEKDSSLVNQWKFWKQYSRRCILDEDEVACLLEKNPTLRVRP